MGSDEGGEVAGGRPGLVNVVHVAQCVAGALAARQRGDHGDASRLLTEVVDRSEMLEGAMLLATISLGLYGEHIGESMDTCVQDLNLRMEQVARSIQDSTE